MFGTFVLRSTTCLRRRMDVPTDVGERTCAKRHDEIHFMTFIITEFVAAKLPTFSFSLSTSMRPIH